MEFTERNEASQENLTLEDAIFSLRLMDSILLGVYSKKRMSIDMFPYTDETKG